MKETRPGWKTTEFWLTLAANLAGAALAAGLFPADSTWAKIAGVVVMALATMGYSFSRGKAKSGDGFVRLGLMLRMLALSMAVIVGSCGTCDWRANYRKTLLGVHQAGVAAHAFADKACAPVLELCKRSKQNPCKALLTCQGTRRKTIAALLNLQQSVVVADLTVEAADKKDAAAALRAVLTLALEVQRAVAAWKGVLK